MAETFTISEALSEGWRLTTSNYWKLLGWGGLILLVQIVPQVLQGNDESLAVSLLSLVVAVVSLVLSVALNRVLLMLVDGKKVKFSDIFWFDGHMVWAYFVSSILYGLIVLGGFLLFIIPAFIWGIMFSQYEYAIVDKKLSARASLSYSKQITNGKKRAIVIAGISTRLDEFCSRITSCHPSNYYHSVVYYGHGMGIPALDSRIQ